MTEDTAMVSRAEGGASRVLRIGAIAIVVAAAPYKLFDLDRFFVPKELTLALAATTIAVLCVSRAREWSLTRADELLAFSLGLTVLSGLFSTNLWLAERSVVIALSGAACFWCAKRLVSDGYGRSLVAVLAFAGAVGAIASLMQAYGVQTELFSLNRAPGGTFGNRNFMAHLCAITLPAMLFSGMRARTGRTLLLWCGGLAAVGAALMLSRTRAAWLAMIAGMCILLISGFIALRRRDDTLRLRRIWLLFLAMVAGPALSIVVPNSLDWRSDSPYLDTAQGLVNYKGGSGHGRLIQYGNSLKMSVRHPLLGVGPGNWAVVYPKFASDNDPSLTQDGMTANPWPSSDWVTFVSERGIPAAALLGVALLAMIVSAVRALFAEGGSEPRFSAAVFLATLVSVMVVGLFDAVLLLPAPALIGWSLLGALTPASRVRRVVPASGVRRTLAVLLIAVLGVAACARSGAQIIAMSLYDSSTRLATLERASMFDPGSYRIHARLAETYERRGDCQKAKPHAASAKQLFPFSPAAKRLVAACVSHSTSATTGARDHLERRGLLMGREYGKGVTLIVVRSESPVAPTAVRRFRASGRTVRAINFVTRKQPPPWEGRTTSQVVAVSAGAVKVYLMVLVPK